MTRNVGTVARGVRCPIIRQGDNLSEIIVDSVIEASNDISVTYENLRNEFYKAA